MSILTRSVRKGRFKEELLKLEDDGWTAVRTSGGHIKLTHKHAARPVFCAYSPSCTRAYKNMRSDCRKALALGASERKDDRRRRAM